MSADEVRAVIETEAAENDEFELKRELPAKKGADPWMSGQKIGDNAKDELAAEIIAFANASGGTLIVGIGEDTATKRAVGPIRPVPRCKEAADRLHQAISDRIEPKLPSFECAGVITEEDGLSGVVIMRTLESYLAPHRHTQDNHCYIRRHDRAEKMSMLEIQELTRRRAQSLEEIEKTFRQSADEYFNKWIPEANRRIHPGKSMMGAHEDDGHGAKNYVGRWGMRLTAVPLAPLVMPDISRMAWIKEIGAETFNGPGRQGYLACHDLDVVRIWQPRLRSVEREFRGDQFVGRDRITSSGRIERFVQANIGNTGARPKRLNLPASTLMWHFASMLRLADIIRAQNSRPSQKYAMEVEFLSSDAVRLYAYAGIEPHGIQAFPGEAVIFPRYEVGDQEDFNRILTQFDKDLWNLSSFNPDWELAVNWPKAAVVKT